MTNKFKRKYTWKPDVPDKRDYLFSKIVAKLPTSVDLRSTCSRIEDQGNLGSCTANALAGAVEFLENKNRTTFFDASRLFIYYNERVLEGTVSYDSGAMLRDGIKTLNKQGFCTEPLWPYLISKFKLKPNNACYTDAAKRKISTYQRVVGLSAMKNCLASGYPFVFGFAVYDSFESDEVANTGTVPMPGPGESLLGGHAVLAVGYDDVAQRILVRNSWGTNWGTSGYFTLPYNYINDTNLADDMWMITK
jgi:C1A family cysteine protease